MPTTVEKLKLEVEIDDYVRGLKEAGKSAKEIKSQVSAYRQALMLQVKAQELAGKAGEEANRKIADSIRKTEAVGRVFGGTLGQMTGLIGDAADVGGVASIAIGGVGVAAIAAAAGLGLMWKAGNMVVDGMVSVADHTREALARLAELEGAADGPSAAAAAGLREWDQATLALEAATADLWQQLGAELLPTLATVVQGTAFVIEKMDGAVEAFYDFGRAIDGVTRPLTALGTLGTSELLRSIGDAAAEAAQEIHEVEGSTASFAEALFHTADREAAATAAANRAAEARRSAAAAAREAAAAEERLAQAIDDAQSDTRTALEEVGAVYEERIEQADKAAAAGLAAAEVDKLRAEAAARFERDLTRIKVEEAEKQAELDAEINERLDKQTQQRVEALYAQLAQEKAAKDQAAAEDQARWGAAKSAASSFYSSATDLAFAALDAKIEAGEGGTKAEQEAAMKAWRLRQSLAVGMAIVDASTAYLGLLTSLAPLGFAAPIVAGAIVAPSLAASLIQINSAPPPEFPDGGLHRPASPDHHVAAVEPGEFTVSRRGVRNTGVAQLEQVSRGEGGALGPQVIVNRYRNRDLSVVVQDQLRMDTPLARELDLVNVPGRRRGR